MEYVGMDNRAKVLKLIGSMRGCVTNKGKLKTFEILEDELKILLTEISDIEFKKPIDLFEIAKEVEDDKFWNK